jgi:hypothetical protein
VSQEKYSIGPRTLLSLDDAEQIFVQEIHQEMYHKYESAFSDDSDNISGFSEVKLRHLLYVYKEQSIELNLAYFLLSQERKKSYKSGKLYRIPVDTIKT